MSSSDARVIQALSQDTLEPVATLPLTSSSSSANSYDLLRWGRDGLALRASTNYSYNSSSDRIILVRGGFVLPQWLATNPQPSLASASPSATGAGSPNLYITLSGSGFVPGAVLLWNGAERTTYFVDANTLRGAIPAADFASPGTALLTVSNPGSTASGSITFVVN